MFRLVVEGAECKGSISSRSCTKGGSRTHPRSYANDQYQIIPTAQQIAWFGIPGNEHKPCFVLMHGRHFTFIMVTEGQYLVKSNHAPCFASAGTASSTSIQWKTKSFANNATYPPPGVPIAWAAAITLTRAEEMQYIMTHCQRFAGSLSPWMRPKGTVDAPRHLLPIQTDILH